MYTDKHILLYDGVCVLCHSSISWVLKRDSADNFRFAPLQSESAKRLLTSVGVNSDLSSVVLLTPKGALLTRSDAALEVLKVLGGAWRVLYLFRWVPKFIRDAVYAFIAKNRYRWFGQREESACQLIPPKWQHKFLE